MSDIPFISFVTLNKFLYTPKSQFPHLKIGVVVL